MCLRGLFDENWITLLTAGIEFNLLEPGEHARIWDRTDNNRTVFYDSDNWRRISQYRQFVCESPCVSVATALLDTDSVNFFLTRYSPTLLELLLRYPGTNEPHWSAEGLDTVGCSKHRALLTPAKRGKGRNPKSTDDMKERTPAERRASMMLGTNPKTRLQDRH